MPFGNIVKKKGVYTESFARVRSNICEDCGSFS